MIKPQKSNGQIVAPVYLMLLQLLSDTQLNITASDDIDTNTIMSQADNYAQEVSNENSNLQTGIYN